MQPSDDIYRKEVTPFLARRRKKRHPSRRAVAPGEAPREAEPARSDHSLYHEHVARRSSRHEWRRLRRSSSSGRHRRKHRDEPVRSGSRILWGSLLVILVAYLAILGSTLLRKPAAEGDAQKPRSGEAGAAAAAERALAAEGEAAAIAERIEGWNAAKKSLEIAMAHMAEAQYEAASLRLEEGLRSSPHNLSLKMALAESYMQQMRYQQAREVLLELLAADPDRPGPRLLLARTLLAQKQDDAALAVAKWVLQDDPYSAEAHDAASSAYMNLGKPGWAVPHLRKIVSLNRDDFAAQNKLALAYSQLGEYEKAAELFKSLLKMEKVDSLTYYNLAACYAHQQMADKAAEALSEAASLFGKSFVSSWIQARDFDPIREDPRFKRLAEEVSQLPRAAAQP